MLKEAAHSLTQAKFGARRKGGGAQYKTSTA